MQISDHHNAATLSKVLCNMVALLEMRPLDLSDILCMPLADVEEFLEGSYVLNVNKEEFRRGVELVHLFKCISQITGDNTRSMISWLNTSNRVLGDLPLNLIRTKNGLADTIRFADAFVSKL